MNDAVARARAQKVLKAASVPTNQISFHLWPTDRVWTRDSGAIFLRRERSGKKEIAATDWKFNAWAKYSDWKRDNLIAAKMAKAIGAEIFEPLAEINGNFSILFFGAGRLHLAFLPGVGRRRFLPLLSMLGPSQRCPAVNRVAPGQIRPRFDQNLDRIERT